MKSGADFAGEITAASQGDADFTAHLLNQGRPLVGLAGRCHPLNTHRDSDLCENIEALLMFFKSYECCSCRFK